MGIARTEFAIGIMKREYPHTSSQIGIDSRGDTLRKVRYYFGLLHVIGLSFANWISATVFLSIIIIFLLFTTPYIAMTGSLIYFCKSNPQNLAFTKPIHFYPP